MLLTLAADVTFLSASVTGYFPEVWSVSSSYSHCPSSWNELALWSLIYIPGLLCQSHLRTYSAPARCALVLSAEVSIVLGFLKWGTKFLVGVHPPLVFGRHGI